MQIQFRSHERLLQGEGKYQLIRRFESFGRGQREIDSS